MYPDLPCPGILQGRTKNAHAILSLLQGSIDVKLARREATTKDSGNSVFLNDKTKRHETCIRVFGRSYSYTLIQVPCLSVLSFTNANLPKSFVVASLRAAFISTRMAKGTGQSPVLISTLNVSFLSYSGRCHLLFFP